MHSKKVYIVTPENLEMRKQIIAAIKKKAYLVKTEVNGHGDLILEKRILRTVSGFIPFIETKKEVLYKNLLFFYSKKRLKREKAIPIMLKV